LVGVGIGEAALSQIAGLIHDEDFPCVFLAEIASQIDDFDEIRQAFVSAAKSDFRVHVEELKRFPRMTLDQISNDTGIRLPESLSLGWFLNISMQFPPTRMMENL